MMSSPARLVLHLSLIDDIGPVTIDTILKSMADTEGAGDEIYHFSVTDFKQRCSLTERTAQKLVHGLADFTVVEAELALADRLGVAIVTRCDDEYPTLLKHIYAPPAVMYVQGAQLVPDAVRLAVVGSRMATEYAQKAIEFLIEPLVHAGWHMVSGGAIGADSMVHAHTVRLGGITVAVLGSGLLNPYPVRNKRLFADICASGGAVISPFPLRMEALPGNFPARNRIISGISHGCLVVQAAAKSGALITAHHALEQGREVFALPGPIDSPLSAGCHTLIQQGAKLVTNAHDIAQELGYRVAASVTPELPKIAQASLTAHGHPSSSAADVQLDLVENGSVPPAVPTASPETVEERIRASCAVATSLDELMNRCGMPLDQLQATLFDLYLAGKVRRTLMGLWERV